MVGPGAEKFKQNVALAAAIAGLAAYFAVFFATRLPTLEERLAAAGTPQELRRIELVGQILLLPDEYLLESWFGRSPGPAVLDRLPVLALAGVVLAASGAAGWLLMVLVRAERGLSRLETVCFAVPVGTSAVSTYTLAAGLLGALGHPAVFWLPAVAVLAAAAWIAWRRRARSPRPTPRAPRSTPRLLWLAAPFAAAIVLGSMLPPSEFDVREYHLQAPKEWFQQGRIGFMPHNVYANMPLGAEMLPLAAMGLSGDWWLGALAGKTAMGTMSLIAAAALFATGSRLFSPRAGAVAAVVYLSTPWIVQVSTTGLIDGVTACYAFTAVYALLVWQDPEKGDKSNLCEAPSGPRPTCGRCPGKLDSSPFSVPSPCSSSRLLLAGNLAGAAAGTKYPGLLFVVLPLAVWVAVVGLRAEGARAWKPVGAFALAALAACGLWYGKNAALSGNPTYPLFYDVFGGATWTADKDARWNRVHRPHDFSPSRLGDDLSKLGWRSEWLSPLVVPLAVLAFFWKGKGAEGKRERTRWILLGLFAYVIVVWWLLTHRIDRFWLPALPLLALLAGAGAWWRDDRAWRVVLGVALGAGLVTNFFIATGVPAAGGDNRYFVSLDTLRRDEARIDDEWHLWLNSHARDGVVLLVGDAQPFDLEMPVLYSTCFDDCLFEQLANDRTPEEVRAALGQHGITHVYVRWGEIARYRKPGNYGFTDFVQPEVFDRLTAAGVLEPLPPRERHLGRVYRVR